jgi:hypothetical protein
MKLRLLSFGLLVMSFSTLVAYHELKIEEGLVSFPWRPSDECSDLESFIKVVQCVEDNPDDEQFQKANEFFKEHNMLLVVTGSSFFFIKNNCPKNIPSSMSHIKWLPNILVDGIKSQLNFENRTWDLDLKIPTNLNVRASEHIRLSVIDHLARQIKPDEIGKNLQEMKETLGRIKDALEKIEKDHEDEDYSHLQQPPSWFEWASSKLKFW